MRVKSANTLPALRFSGYTSQTETHELGKVTKVIDCKHRTPEYVERGIPIVSPGSIRWGEIDLVSPTKRVTEEDYESLMDHCEPGVSDLVFSRNQSLGIASYITSGERFVLGQDTVLIRQKNGNGMLIFHRLQTTGTQNLIARLSGGSTFSRINLKDIRLLPLTLPKEESEQLKIADFLTTVDGRIGQLIRKRALLEDYKKGVMQQLFTQSIRFRDDHGNDFPDWEEKKLGELTSKVGSGSTPTGGAKVYRQFGVLFIRSQNVNKNALDLTNSTFITSAIHEKMKGSTVQPLDVLLNITGASIGRSCVVPEGFSTGNVNQHVCIIRPRWELSALFLQLYLSSFWGQKLILRGQAGGGREGLNFQSIRIFKIPMPIPEEQTKIADFLSAIDRKIESVATQITETQTFKRGLLQQMFV